MKKIILAGSMVLALVATAAFAGQNKNSKPASKPAPTMTGNKTSTGGGGKHHKRHHRRHHKGGGSKSSNTGGGGGGAAKSNSNKKKS